MEGVRSADDRSSGAAERRHGDAAATSAATTPERKRPWLCVMGLHPSHAVTRHGLMQRLLRCTACGKEWAE